MAKLLGHEIVTTTEFDAIKAEMLTAYVNDIGLVKDKIERTFILAIIGVVLGAAGLILGIIAVLH